MNLLELIYNRYTTKSYNPEKKILTHDFELLKKVLTHSPSSINSQPWVYYIVEDQKTKEALSEVSFHNKSKILDSDVLIVFTSFNSSQDFENQMDSYISEFTKAYYHNNIKILDEKAIVKWMEQQVYISLGFFLYAVASLGIDSTPMEGIEKNKYNEILKLKNTHSLFAVCLGYRADDDANQPSIKLKSRKPKEETIKII